MVPSFKGAARFREFSTLIMQMITDIGIINASYRLVNYRSACTTSIAGMKCATKCATFQIAIYAIYYEFAAIPLKIA